MNIRGVAPLGPAGKRGARRLQVGRGSPQEVPHLDGDLHHLALQEAEGHIRVWLQCENMAASHTAAPLPKR